ncbi:hypothetical protein [Loktanella sp. S4079]|uniref:hypothetical protein n=1 Tax=Loktanella sp. S4079 TaxID=579483 RepID=UPI0005FA3278|nr:hypothetical protein [Loktanella sp. S4079]KJZ17938.1 hypothetical protein TW80_16520 [Loktanella sp. S4079]
MQVKATGPKASVVKYDILTALMTLGLHDKGIDGRLAQRLALLITARFNWQSETFSVGLREIARMWSVTERTTKRELALMRARGWISVHRNAARGRVAEHRVHLNIVLEATRLCWPLVGPDFVARMGQGPQEQPASDNVVPFAKGATKAPQNDGTLWAAASRVIYESDPAIHTAWFAKVTEHNRDGALLELAAPSAFAARYIETHFAGRILAAVTACDPSVTKIRITG